MSKQQINQFKSHLILTSPNDLDESGKVTTLGQTFIQTLPLPYFISEKHTSSPYFGIQVAFNTEF